MVRFNLNTGDCLFQKNRYDAFYNTQLDDYLHSNQIQTIIIGGVMTNLCCETTARAVFVHDYHVIFLADGTAAASEEMVIGTLRNLGFGFAHIRSMTQITCHFMESNR